MKDTERISYQGMEHFVGAIINDPTLYHKVSYIRPIHFTKSEAFDPEINDELNNTGKPSSWGNRLPGVWAAIEACMTKGMIPTPEIITGINPEISHGYLMLLSEHASPASNVEEEAKIIVNRWQLQQMEYIASDISYGVRNGARENTEEFLSTISENISNVIQYTEVESKFSSKDVLMEAQDTIDGEGEYFHTPWERLNRKTILSPSDVVILAARPSVGKTSLALNWMLHLAGRDVPTCFFSLETSKRLIGKRLVAIDSGVVIHKGASPGDKDLINESIDRMSEMPFFVYDSVFHINQIISSICTMKKKYGCKVFFIDYLQLIGSGVGDSINTNVAVSKISRELKMTAISEDVMLVILSQLNRNVEHRQSPKPMLSDLRDSGSIEQDASHAWLMYQENEHDDRVNIFVAKQKDGPQFETALFFDKPVYTFSDNKNTMEFYA